MKSLKILLLVFCAMSAARLFAAEWQWSAVVPKSAQGARSIAYLWVPPNCNHVKAVIVGSSNMLELGIFERPNFRKALSELGIAEVYATPSFDP